MIINWFRDELLFMFTVKRDLEIHLLLTIVRGKIFKQIIKFTRVHFQIIIININDSITKHSYPPIYPPFKF